MLCTALFQSGGSQSAVQRNGSSENGQGLLSRWLSSHYHGGVHDEKSVARHTVNLLTSTIKVDADQSDLRFCFRIISPMKVYTLQVCHRNAAQTCNWILTVEYKNNQEKKKTYSPSCCKLQSGMSL
jgi:Arf-GAP/coiled-coil/ANK repeat/PH domain-containing protein